MSRDTVDLNFISVDAPGSAALVHVRPILDPLEGRPHPKVRAYSIPLSAPRDQYAKHWVSVDAVDGYEAREIAFEKNPDLACWILFESLVHHIRESLSDEQEAEEIAPRFVRELRLPMHQHEEGTEELVLQPYFLAAHKKLGLLADFHFSLADGVPFSRRVQQLSLSLNRSFKRNLDYYADRLARIRKFLDKRWEVISAFPLRSDGRIAHLNHQFEPLSAERLHSKTYVFANELVDKNPYAGLRNIGPLRTPSQPTRLTFVFRETERTAARHLALAIRGNPRDRSLYPGYTSLFRTPLEIDSSPIVLTDFGLGALQSAVTALVAKGDNVLPVLVLPEKQKDIYFQFKSLSTHRHLASQVCTSKIINDDNALKWSIANIGLQLFCKAGGLPWKVQPTEEHSLIVGISQSHKEVFENGRRRIDRHFAFSVLTDSSGLFQRIEVLGDNPDRAAYLTDLSNNLQRVLRDSLTSVKRVVLHTSFKLRHDEMIKIRDVVNTVSASPDNKSVQFAVAKINDRSRFFATNPTTNSLVPAEGTFTRLGRRQYLVWFEGIVPPRNTVTKAYPGPTHIELIRLEAADNIDELIILQDLANLSGANWRGFNARSVPVSVLYCKLVADFVQEFYARHLPAPNIADMRPWFL